MIPQGRRACGFEADLHGEFTALGLQRGRGPDASLKGVRSTSIAGGSNAMNFRRPAAQWDATPGRRIPDQSVPSSIHQGRPVVFRRSWSHPFDEAQDRSCDSIDARMSRPIRGVRLSLCGYRRGGHRRVLSSVRTCYETRRIADLTREPLRTRSQRRASHHPRTVRALRQARPPPREEDVTAAD